MTVTQSIGATGRTWGTILAWEAGTDISLSQQYIGEVYHDLTVGEPTETLAVGDDRLHMNGATSINQNRYRTLRAATGQQYDPVAKTGVWLKRTIGATSIKADAVRIEEERFHLERMAFISDYVTPPTTGTSIAVDFYMSSANIRGYLKRCYIDWGAHYCDGTAGTASGTAVNVDNWGATYVEVFNNIIVGGGARGNRGCNYGIRFRSNSDGRILGNTVVDVVGWNESSAASVRGIEPGTGNAIYDTFNNIVVWDLAITSANPYAAGIDNAYYTQASRGFITSDVSAESYGFGGAAFNKSNVVKGQLFVSAINNDYRLLSSAPAQDWDGLQTHYAFNGITTDFFGDTRSTVYADIGACDGAVAGVENAPTTVISTIGTGGTYADIVTWEAATDINLIESNEVHIGEMLGDFTSASVLVVSGAITDSARYRELRPASTNHYSPLSDRGCTVNKTVFDVTVTHTISIQEKFFRLTGPMKVTSTLTYPGTSGTSAVIGVGRDADNAALESLFVTLSASTAGYYLGVLASEGQQNCSIKSCVIYGHAGADNNSLHAGIRIKDYGQWKIYGCSIYGTKLGSSLSGTQVGIKIDSSTTCELRNNIVIDCYHSGSSGSADYSIGSTPTTSCSNNMSGDATAPGVDSLTSKTAANTWVNAGARNFYLKAGISEAREAGIERVNGGPLGTKLDALRNGRYRPYDMGALEGVQPYPQFPSPQIRNRVCHCYEIVRRDGVRLLLTDNNTPIVFMGDTWDAASMDSSARRREIGMKAMDMEASGGITSDKITLLDLRTGRYQGARITEYLVDWRYPHLKPLAEARYTIESTTFNGEAWKADVKGLPFILQNKVGDVFGRNCRYVLGDTECRAVLTGLTQTGKAVLDVIDKRQSWYVSASALTSAVTDYYSLGKLTWLTGNNTDIETELFKNEVVAVNALADPNTLLESSSDWLGNIVTTTQVTNGFDTGIHSWNFNIDAGSGEPYLVQNNVGGSATLWSDYAPKDTKVCFSVWIRTKALANPASGTCKIKLLNVAGVNINWQGIFEQTAGVWSVRSSDIGTTAEVSTVGAPDANWYRLSIGRFALGDEPDKIGVKMVINGATNEDAEFSQAQLEVDVLTPTSWTVSTKHKLQLAVRADADIVDGDTFDLEPGCDKLLATCKDKFSNIKNYGGFPYIPGVDAMFDTPTQ